jgi:Flp pilus assembly protein TadG
MGHDQIVTMPGRRWRRGQALTELALIIPVMLLLFLGALDLGRLFYGQITITNAAKEGALVASRGGTYVPNAACSGTNSVMCAALAEAKGGFVEVDQSKVVQNPATNIVCPIDAAVGSTVSVTVNAPFQLLTPLISGIIGAQGITLSATAQAECAVLPQAALVTPPPPTTCPLVLVPDVDGLSAPAAANAAITGAGLIPTAIGDLTTGPKNKASNQSPDDGTCVASGSIVTYHYRP